MTFVSNQSPVAAIAPACLLTAAQALLPKLEQGEAVDTPYLKSVMTDAFQGTDADGAWDWKMAYDACEAATVLFVRKYAAALRGRLHSPKAVLGMLTKMVALLPTHTRRSEDSETFQQFSTPLPLGLAAYLAAGINKSDVVLEPSAGTGLLAILAEMSGSRIWVNELADLRGELLRLIFPSAGTSRFDAASIDDYLPAGLAPSVVLMNPPFSVMANVDRKMSDAVARHIASALARLAPGGRLVTLTGANFAPDRPAWRDTFTALQQDATLVFNAAIDGAVYRKHGTTIDTRLLVFDKLTAEHPDKFIDCLGIAPDAETLLTWVTGNVPPRPEATGALPSIAAVGLNAFSAQGKKAALIRPVEATATSGVELAYEHVDWTPPEGVELTDAVYEGFSLQSIRIPGAQPHPTQLVQSAAMASVAPPKPKYRPHLPAPLVENGLLSDAQLESVIYAGEAHGAYLAGRWTVDATYDNLAAARDDNAGAVQFRRGWFLGDGTGSGKGRQVAGIILDNWLKGRRRAIWISKSDKLLEDAQRDWSALGQERLLVTPLSRFKQGQNIRLDQGILFTTYATLRSEDRGEKESRINQIINWLGSDFDGVVIFDEAHSMQNAGGGKGVRGDVSASQQGRAGLRLQHALPNARIVYVSATGATNVQNLAYAQRLGLWGGRDFPFKTRSDFVEAIEGGGVAAMEVLARDLKALGLYTARSLSYEGVQYDMLVHELSPGWHGIRRI